MLSYHGVTDGFSLRVALPIFGLACLGSYQVQVSFHVATHMSAAYAGFLVSPGRLANPPLRSIAWIDGGPVGVGLTCGDHSGTACFLAITHLLICARCERK